MSKILLPTHQLKLTMKPAQGCITGIIQLESVNKEFVI